MYRKIKGYQDERIFLLDFFKKKSIEWVCSEKFLVRKKGVIKMSLFVHQLVKHIDDRGGRYNMIWCAGRYAYIQENDELLVWRLISNWRETIVWNNDIDLREMSKVCLGKKVADTICWWHIPSYVGGKKEHCDKHISVVIAIWNSSCTEASALRSTMNLIKEHWRNSRSYLIFWTTLEQNDNTTT